MINAGEAGIVTVLQQAVALFQSDLGFFVPDIYAQLTTAAQNEITTWWQNPKNGITVQDGYTMAPVQGVQFAVITGTEHQIPSRRYIGNFFAQSGLSNQYSTTFETVYSIGVLSPNRNQLLWLQMLAKWGLLYNLTTLENSYGLFNAVVSAGPMMPVPDSLKDSVFPFMRTVELTAQHEDTWTTPPATAVTSASITLTDTTA